MGVNGKRRMGTKRDEKWRIDRREGVQGESREQNGILEMKFCL